MHLAALLSFISGTVAAVVLAVPALVRSDYLALGVSTFALGVASATAWYVYIKVARAGRQTQRVARVEADAAEIDRRLAK